MKQDDKQIEDRGRREFIRDTAKAGAGVAIAATLPGAVVAEQGETSETKPAQKGYRLTRHILEYYKSLTA